MKELMIQNITSWEKLNVNYWGIPKSGNSSVKKKLIESSTDIHEVDDSIHTYDHHIYHSIAVCKYITKKEAISNGFTNFTLVRNPYNRFISMFKDLKRTGTDYFSIKEKNVNTVDNLLHFIENTETSNLNYHFRSQSSFVFVNGKIAAEKVFKLEEMKKLELFLNLGKFDIVNKIDADIVLTEKQKEKIYDIYHKDFKLFGYKK